MTPKSWVEVAPDYKPSEECPSPGEDMTLEGSLVVEDMGLVHVALEAKYDKGAIPLVDFDIQDNREQVLGQEAMVI